MFVTTRFAPEALAFPYHVKVGETNVFSEQPIDGEALSRILKGSDARLRSSEIYGEGFGRRLFLTQGGWRWRLLSLEASDGFAVSLPFGEAIVLNRTNLSDDSVTNGAVMAGHRSVTGVVTHERTHGLIRAKFGILADRRYPVWLREGYCDAVAQESSLSERDAQALSAAGRTVPALPYYLGRKRVEEELRSASVSALFARNQLF